MVGLTLSVSLSVSLTLSSLSSRLPTEQHAQILVCDAFLCAFCSNARSGRSPVTESAQISFDVLKCHKAQASLVAGHTHGRGPSTRARTGRGNTTQLFLLLPPRRPTRFTNREAPHLCRSGRLVWVCASRVVVEWCAEVMVARRRRDMYMCMLHAPCVSCKRCPV